MKSFNNFLFSCQNQRLIFERPKNSLENLPPSLHLKNQNIKRSLKYLFLRLSSPILVRKTIPRHLLEILGPLGLPPTAWWSPNSSGTNFLVLGSTGFLMQPLMGGSAQISIDAVTRGDGRWLLLRLPRISYLVASQQLNGNPHPQVSISPAPTRSCSVWMRAANTLSRGEAKMLLYVTVMAVLCLGNGT